MEQDIKLTKLASCAGCGAKVGAGVLAQLLEGIRVHADPNLLVGFDKSDDASVYKISDDLALVQTVDFFPRLPMTPTPLEPLPPPMRFLIFTPWAASQSWR